MKKLNIEYGEFIGKLNWNLFITITNKDGCSEFKNRIRMENLYKRNKKLINKMFYVSERNKNYFDTHSHILIDTNYQDELIKNLNGLKKSGNLKILNIEKEFFTIDRVLSVGYYLTKFIDKDIDYDIFL